MIVNDKDLIFNINTLIVLPTDNSIDIQSDIKTYEYNFKYVYLFEPCVTNANKLIDFVKSNNIQEVVLLNYRYEYDLIIEKLRYVTKIKSLITFDLSSLSLPINLYSYNALNKLNENHNIEKVGFTDSSLYTIEKSKYDNVCMVYLDEKIDDTAIKADANPFLDGIGLLNDSVDEKHSYYNELSAISILDESANILKSVDKNDTRVKDFNKRFGIEYTEYKDVSSILESSKVNLYVNFCNNEYSYFLRSMDMEIPCILGNNTLINDYKKLVDLVQVKSDDSINEIASKIKEVQEKKDEIFKEYKIFRIEYTKKCQESIANFVIGNAELKNNSEKDELLLTVGIPVYNVEKYLGMCLNSVIAAINKSNTEILIVNDGSKDNSEEVINKYVKKYPEFIRYIKQENHGLGNVRNVVMENARGKYIASIDSDDTINPRFFKEAEEYLKNDVDMVLCNWLSKPINGEAYPTPALDENFKFDNRFKKILFATIMPSNCNKIMKKSLYKKLNIKFIENLKYEDLSTNPIILNELETIKYIDRQYYEYYLRENSIMRSSAGYDMIDMLRILDDRFKEYVGDSIKFDKKEFMAYVYAWRIEELIINQLYNLDKDERNKMIEHIYDKMDGILKDIYDNNEYLNNMIDRIDEETKAYIYKRNKAMVEGKLKEFIDESIKDNSYKILTPALLLYNIDNR